MLSAYHVLIELVLRTEEWLTYETGFEGDTHITEMQIGHVIIVIWAKVNGITMNLLNVEEKKKLTGNFKLWGSRNYDYMKHEKTTRMIFGLDT